MVEAIPLFQTHAKYAEIQKRRSTELAEILKSAPSARQMQFGRILRPKNLDQTLEAYSAWNSETRAELEQMFDTTTFWQTAQKEEMERQYGLDLSTKEGFVKLYMGDIFSGALLADQENIDEAQRRLEKIIALSWQRETQILATVSRPTFTRVK